MLQVGPISSKCRPARGVGRGDFCSSLCPVGGVIDLGYANLTTANPKWVGKQLISEPRHTEWRTFAQVIGSPSHRYKSARFGGNAKGSMELGSAVLASFIHLKKSATLNPKHQTLTSFFGQRLTSCLNSKGGTR